MTDINKLKELAERATPGPWTTDAAQSVIADSDQLNSGWVICECFGSDEKANRDFMVAANPHAILGLLERLKLAELKGLMDARSNEGLIKDIGRLKSQNDLMLNAIVKSRTALMVGRPTSKVAGQKYTEAFAAIVAALEGATQ